MCHVLRQASLQFVEPNGAVAQQMEDVHRPFAGQNLEGDQPRVRPFGVVAEFEGKLCIATNNEKSVCRQMLANPRVEISAMNHGTWLRLEAKAHHDDRRAARERMLEENPSLNRTYRADDGRFAVLCLEDATATIFGGGEGPKVVKF